jgi:integrase
LDLINQSHLEVFKAATIKKQFERVIETVISGTKIEHIYSPHDFRHYAACKFYKENA